DAELVIKGPRPEEYDFMHSASRSPELDYYNSCYDKINSEPLIKDRVKFVPWGNDMPAWYEGIDFILSPSDFESFHYAVADGVLSGCVPVIWPWDEAESIYAKDWIFDDNNAQFEVIDATIEDRETRFSRILKNRLLVVEKYSFQ